MTSGANNKNLIMHLNNVQGMVRGVQGAHDPLLSGGLFLSTSDFSVVGNVANSYLSKSRCLMHGSVSL